MKKTIKTFSFLLLLLTAYSANSQDFLTACWQKQTIQDEYLSFSYQEKMNELGHNFEPWEQTNYIGKGTVWVNTSSFYKQDTLSRGKRTYYSKIELNNSELLFLDYGDKELFAVTKETFLEQTNNTARYSPITLLNYFVQNKITLASESNPEFAIYKTTINKTILTLYIRKADMLLQKLTILSDDDLFGDVLTSFNYSNFLQIGDFHFPKKIGIDKINGKVKDEVLLSNPHLSKTPPSLLERPADYKLQEEEEIIPEIKVEKFNEHIHFVELKHTDDRIMIVEFSDFLLVAEAPMNSENGQLIIAEAKKIAPNKAIKYFVFGHYHPHYLGGVRPFIHQSAQIICSDINQAYVEYIANAAHSINPDSLELEPKPLKIKHIQDSLSINDGNFEMKIYFIGEKSAHTKDYLIYYFPKYQLLFQDDLVWIKRRGEIKKARSRQAGLYTAIKELGLTIKTIIQSWPVADYGVKTVIPFKDLEASMKK